MPPIIPDLIWYTDISKQKDMLPRCPFANVRRCPRYYQSLSLLGEAGISTQIDQKEDEELLQYWGNTELWPVIAEESTGILSANVKHFSFTNFCPEISFAIFGLFADNLHKYSDEIDIDHAHVALAKEGASHNDWRWSWARVSPMHYSDCPLYSLLSIGSSLKPTKIGF